jgi:hypothetical protein
VEQRERKQNVLNVVVNILVFVNILVVVHTRDAGLDTDMVLELYNKLVLLHELGMELVLLLQLALELCTEPEPGTAQALEQARVLCMELVLVLDMEFLVLQEL